MKRNENPATFTAIADGERMYVKGLEHETVKEGDKINIGGTERVVFLIIEQGRDNSCLINVEFDLVKRASDKEIEIRTYSLRQQTSEDKPELTEQVKQRRNCLLGESWYDMYDKALKGGRNEI